MTEKKTAHAKQNASTDPFEILKADHKTIKGMCASFDSLVQNGAPAPERGELVHNLCGLLQAHTEIEEDVFYPALRECLDDPLLIDEAEVEHGVAKQLIEQIRAMQPDDPKYNATVIVMCEYVGHHIEEEEGEIFKQAKHCKSLNLNDLGSQMASRK